MQAPTISELLQAPIVQQAIEQAWLDSEPADARRRHEEGGWVYADTSSGSLSVRRAPSGAQAMLDLGAPPFVTGSVVVSTFHTHPNPTAEGWNPRPSDADTRSAGLLGGPTTACTLPAPTPGAVDCREIRDIHNGSA